MNTIPGMPCINHDQYDIDGAGARGLCPCCGGRMLIIETFARGCEPKYQPATAPLVIRIDTS